MSVFDHSEFDQHEHVAFCNDEASGLRAIIAVHNTALGPSLGGCRMWPYNSDEDALYDVLRLSKGMSYKAAMAGLPQGGGKAVIMGDPRTQKTPQKMAAMGRFVESLGGRYISAEDSGISVNDLKIMAQQSTYIAGIAAKYHISSEIPDGNPSPSTAYGVFIGLQASVKYLLNRDLQGVNVAIQGLGHVGYRLAEHLHKHGANLFVADIYPDNLKKAEENFNAVVVPPEDIFTLDVDVFAPCAMGAAINRRTMGLLRTKIIAGAANNQLESESIGAELLSKGVLYAPDYVINAGGIIDIYHQKRVSSAEAMRLHIEQIGATLVEIYQRASELDLPTNIVANTIAEERFKNLKS